MGGVFCHHLCYHCHPKKETYQAVATEVQAKCIHSLAPLDPLAAANVLPSNLPLFAKASTASASSFGTKKLIIFESIVLGLIMSVF